MRMNSSFFFLGRRSYVWLCARACHLFMRRGRQIFVRTHNFFFCMRWAFVWYTNTQVSFEIHLNFFSRELVLLMFRKALFKITFGSYFGDMRISNANSFANRLAAYAFLS